MMGHSSWLESDLTLKFGRSREDPLRFRFTSEARRIAICGPSGVGKSTFLKILAGVEKRCSGTLRVSGVSWQDSGAKLFLESFHRQVGWVPQNALLFPHLTVKKNLLFATGAANENWQEIASQLKIEHLLQRQPRNLSGGESQRVALGRALLSRPKLLLLDEPLSALNDSLRADVISFLARHSIMNEIPMILATHRRSEALALCEEVLDWESGGTGERANPTSQSSPDEDRLPASHNPSPVAPGQSPA